MTNVVEPKKNFFEGRKLWFVFAGIAMTLTAVALFMIISQVTATTKYYILNQEVPARTQITEDILQEVVTSTGGQPPTAVSLEDVLEGELYAKYALDAGDIVTLSNSGPLERINAGVPEGFVTATFTAPASMAVGGKIARGDYIDLISLTTNLEGIQAASYAMQHVLVLDATVNLDNYEAAPAEGETETADAAEGSATRLGIPSMYTVALSKDDAAKLAMLTQFGIYVVLSADQTSEAVIAPSDISVDQYSLGGQIGDSGTGTDNTFGEEKIEETDETVAPEEETVPEDDGTSSDESEISTK